MPMLKQMRAGAVVLSLSTAAVATITAPAEATPVLKIVKVYYNSPGSDTRTNTSINGEYVVIKNMTGTRRSLYRFTVRDLQSHVYTFGTFYLGAYASVTLHTGKGTNTSAHRYWGLSSYVWNNDTDRATLKNASGTTVHYCSYNSTAVAYKNC